MRFGWVTLVAALTPVAAGAGLREIAVPSVPGPSIRPADAGAGPFAVIVFVTTDCPVGNAFQPELRRLAIRAEELGGRFTLVHVDPTVTREAAAEHGKAYAVTAAVAIDRDHRLVRATGARQVPEAVVVDRTGTVVYQGRISNLFVTYGKRRSEATEHDLREAMEALAKGRAPDKPRGEMLGCFIPRL
jgi:hypothetical protein